MGHRKLHSENQGTSYLQDITYGYNERGWLRTAGSPLFALQLKYSDGNTPRYNGSIANQYWSTPGNLNKHYTYSYDSQDRLVSGISGDGYSEQGLDYDAMGNIKHLTRSSGGTSLGTNTYSYTGNRLTGISGFTNASYSYDANGRVTLDGRTGMTVSYNALDLPQSFSSGGTTIAYLYDGLGRKLKRTAGSTGDEYVQGISYRNGVLESIQTEEGRIMKAGSSYSYEYALQDHLGNNRVFFDKNGGTARKIQKTDYYPFGLAIDRYLNGTKNDYLYNGLL